MWPFGKEKISIPRRSMVSVRMEAIGGQGANSAGKLLAEAAVLAHGYTGNHFSSFGSEKRGTPVKSFVRFSTERKPIRTASQISSPDLLMVFHENLLLSHPEVLGGAHSQTDLVLNSPKKPEQIVLPTGVQLRSIATIDATAIATSSQCGINAVMLGAMADFCPEIASENLKNTLDQFFKKRSSVLTRNNLKGFEKGQSQVAWATFRQEQAVSESAHGALPELGWLNAPIGGVILNPGNSVLKDHSTSRKGVAPQFFKEICFNCGFCDMVCPDYCFVWEARPADGKTPQLQGIDYQYCKGCQKCVAVCPVEALRPVPENEIPEDQKKVRAFPELNRAEVENRWKHLDWTAFIDQISDEDRMLTLQTELLDPNSYLRPDFPQALIEKLKKENDQ